MVRPVEVSSGVGLCLAVALRHCHRLPCLGCTCGFDVEPCVLVVDPKAPYCWHQDLADHRHHHLALRPSSADRCGVPSQLPCYFRHPDAFLRRQSPRPCHCTPGGNTLCTACHLPCCRLLFPHRACLGLDSGASCHPTAIIPCLCPVAVSAVPCVVLLVVAY